MVSRTKGGYKIVAYIHVPHRADSKMQLHEEFANTRDEPEAIERFTRRWGALWGEAHLSYENWIAGRNNLRAAWEGKQNVFSKEGRPLPARLTMTKNSCGIEMGDLSITIMILFKRDHWAGKTAKCANADCPAPYFIRKRRTQKYCEAGPCVEQAQREQKRLWWVEHYGKGAK